MRERFHQREPDAEPLPGSSRTSGVGNVSGAIVGLNLTPGQENAIEMLSGFISTPNVKCAPSGASACSTTFAIRLVDDHVEPVEDRFGERVPARDGLGDVQDVAELLELAGEGHVQAVGARCASLYWMLVHGSPSEL